MLELIYTTVHDFLRDHMMIHVILILLSSAMMLASMAIDLYFGVKKAKENGRATTSKGLKKTCEKGRKYFSPYLVLVCIDFLACVVIPIPALSMIWAAYCIFCEFTSVKEKAWEKEELRKAEETFNVVLENKDDLAKAIAQLLTSSGELKKKDNEKD